MVLGFRGFCSKSWLFSSWKHITVGTLIFFRCLYELKLRSWALCRVLVINIPKWVDLEEISQPQDIPWICKNKQCPWASSDVVSRKSFLPVYDCTHLLIQRSKCETQHSGTPGGYLILSEEFGLHKPLCGLFTAMHFFPACDRKNMGEIFASIINPGINQYKLLINEKQRHVAAKNKLLMPLPLLKWHAAYHKCSITSYKIFL